MPISSLVTDGARLILFAMLVVMPALAADDSPVVVTREQWGAKPPIMTMKKQTPVRLTIHHTGAAAKPRVSLANKLKSLQAFSQTDAPLDDGRIKKAWPDIPYHYYIDVNGAVGEARPVEFVGDTNTKYDPTGHITIVVEGNFDKETPTKAEIDALVGLLASLATKYHIDVDKIGAHKQFAQTACPGKNMMALMPEIVARVRERLGSASPHPG
ncbi:N-acetylmuramoyl-L-alanine amidase [Methyloceanibacter sp.]|uniref:N-acetylmuramoyl-L-alanine amidase n=1 Tax=Methyloceanibacter sp. TaxID=1965321 RepID=UPI003D6D0F9A